MVLKSSFELSYKIFNVLDVSDYFLYCDIRWNCVYMCTYLCLYVSVCMYLCMYVLVCVCVCAHVWIYVCLVCVWVCACMYGYMCVWVYMPVVYVCVCVLGYISNRQPGSWQFCSHQHTLLQHKETRAQGLCRSFSVSTQPYIHTTTNSQECSARGFPALPWKVFDSCWRPHVALTLNKDFWLFWLNSHEEAVFPGQAQGQIQAA
jgi:nuclear pore complex protein Nup62